MPVDLPPPVIVTTLAEPVAQDAGLEPYGPIDTEPEHRERDRAGQPPAECPQSSAEVIVVCAPVDPGQYRLGDLPPRGETDWHLLDAATTIRIGPVEIQPQVLDGSPSPIPAKGVGVGVRVRF